MSALVSLCGACAVSIYGAAQAQERTLSDEPASVSLGAVLAKYSTVAVAPPSLYVPIFDEGEGNLSTPASGLRDPDAYPSPEGPILRMEYGLSPGVSAFVTARPNADTYWYDPTARLEAGADIRVGTAHVTTSLLGPGVARLGAPSVHRLQPVGGGTSLGVSVPVNDRLNAWANVASLESPSGRIVARGVGFLATPGPNWLVGGNVEAFTTLGVRNELYSSLDASYRVSSDARFGLTYRLGTIAGSSRLVGTTFNFSF